MSGATVWLASYPKSGNTWLRAILTALMNDGQVDINALSSSGSAGRGSLESLTGWSIGELQGAELVDLRRRADADAGSGPEPDFRKTHDAFTSASDGLPTHDLSATRGVVYLVRDPRDVAVSFAHHLGRSVEETVAMMQDSGAGLARPQMDGGPALQLPQHLGSWSEHVRGWLDQELQPVTVVRYEDLLADPVRQALRVVALADLGCAREQVEAAVSAASFDKLRAQEQDVGFRERAPAHAQFFRKGTAGGWRSDLSADRAAEIVNVHGPVMHRLGYL